VLVAAPCFLAVVVVAQQDLAAPVGRKVLALVDERSPVPVPLEDTNPVALRKDLDPGSLQNQDHQDRLGRQEIHHDRSLGCALVDKEETGCMGEAGQMEAAVVVAGLGCQLVVVVLTKVQLLISVCNIMQLVCIAKYN
jgi:hypothetical protein